MAESHGDGSIAPRRSLSGPILPPPPPELEQQSREAKKREADEAAARRLEAQRQAEKETRQAEKDARRNAQRSAQKSAQGSGSAGRPSSATTTTGSTATAQKAAPRPATSGPRRTRRAQLRLVQVDAWSVMKTAFLLSIALGIVLVVAVGIVWAVLGAAGVWDSINSIVQQAVGSESSKPFDIEQYVGASRVLGFTMIVAVLDVVLITAIATLGAFLYNLSAALLGGIEVTLAEDS